MKIFVLAVFLGSVFAHPGSMQPQDPTGATPTFEVASIRPNAAGGNWIEATPGRLTITSATLATCIKWAYDVEDSQISGANSQVSGLLRSERYDIMAKSTVPVPDSQLKLMLQKLLADRFAMVFHKEMKEAQVYALLVEKSAPKFHESQGEGESRQQGESRQKGENRQQGEKLIRRWTAIRMTELAHTLSDAMEAPVLDETGLSARYDLSVDLTPYMPATGERPDIASMVITGLREQLGLKLESRRSPVAVMVVDHLEKSSAN